MDRLRFWKNHVPGLNEEAMTGRCPRCKNPGFTILWNDRFICLRCPLNGKGIQAFIEQVGDCQLLRVFVRLEQTRNALITQYENREDIPYSQIGEMVLRLEAHRIQVWDRIFSMATKLIGDGEGESWVAVISNTRKGFINDLARDLNLPPEEVEGHLDSLEEFGDIEVTESEVENLEIQVNDLWRKGI